MMYGDMIECRVERTCDSYFWLSTDLELTER